MQCRLPINVHGRFQNRVRLALSVKAPNQRSLISLPDIGKTPKLAGVKSERRRDQALAAVAEAR